MRYRLVRIKRLPDAIIHSHAIIIPLWSDQYAAQQNAPVDINNVGTRMRSWYYMDIWWHCGIPMKYKMREITLIQRMSLFKYDTDLFVEIVYIYISWKTRDKNDNSAERGRKSRHVIRSIRIRNNIGYWRQVEDYIQKNALRNYPRYEKCLPKWMNDQQICVAFLINASDGHRISIQLSEVGHQPNK